MRKLLKLFAFISLSLVLLAILAIAVLHREFDGANVWIDDELVSGPLIAIAIMVVVAFALFIAFLVTLVALASAAVLVPIAIVLAFIVAIGALFIGMAPVLVPVLLVVGACVLLARLFKRPRTPSPATIVEPNPHA